jgi:CBS domain-containing protein
MARRGVAGRAMGRGTLYLIGGDVLLLGPDRPVEDAIDLLPNYRIIAAPIVDNGMPVGIVSTFDLRPARAAAVCLAVN